MEYLKIAQDLEMYGVNYFAIRVSWEGWGSCFPARVISMSWRARRAGRGHLGTPPVLRGGSSSWCWVTARGWLRREQWFMSDPPGDFCSFLSSCRIKRAQSCSLELMPWVFTFMTQTTG